MSGWTAATCTDCWFRMHPERMPTRVKDPDRERCHACGRFTLAGIYIRVSPTLQAFPTHREDD